MTESFESVAHTLGRIRWDVFGTLTFKGKIPPMCHREKPVWRHFNWAAQFCRRPYSQLIIALRSELGELGGRFHYHYLLGGTKYNNMITLAYALEKQWNSATRAIAKVRPYDDSQSGVAYITKCLSGADVYEMNKFDSADQVTLSNSVYRVIGSMERIAKDTRIAHVKKRARAERAT